MNDIQKDLTELQKLLENFIDKDFVFNDSNFTNKAILKGLHLADDTLTLSIVNWERRKIFTRGAYILVHNLQNLVLNNNNFHSWTETGPNRYYVALRNCCHLRFGKDT